MTIEAVSPFGTSSPALSPSVYGTSGPALSPSMFHQGSAALSPSMFHQGSAVGYLGALAQQYHQNRQNHQQLLAEHHRLMEHQNQVAYHNEMIKRLWDETRDNNGFQHSIQFQQLQLQKQLQHTIMPPAADVRSPNSASPKSHNSQLSSPVPIVSKVSAGPTHVQNNSPKTQQKKRVNFHSIADLIGGVDKDDDHSVVAERQKEPAQEGTARGKKRRRSQSKKCSSGGEPGNLLINADRHYEPFSPSAPRNDQTTCGQPITTRHTESRGRDVQPITRRHTESRGDDEPKEERGGERGVDGECRGASPALSTISSGRETDTPASITSLESSVSRDRDETFKKGSVSEVKRSSKSRRIFQAPQIHILEQVFSQCQYPEPAFVEKLARDLDTTDGKIRVWFQNKRARWRKRSNDNDSKQSPWLPGTPLYQPAQTAAMTTQPVNPPVPQMSQKSPPLPLSTSSIPIGASYVHHGYPVMTKAELPPNIPLQFPYNMGFQ